MKQYDVIIIGAGPSGIFCAYELIRQKPDMKILVVEKGRSIEKKTVSEEKDQSVRRLPALFDHYRFCGRRGVFGR